MRARILIIWLCAEDIFLIPSMAAASSGCKAHAEKSEICLMECAKLAISHYLNDGASVTVSIVQTIKNSVAVYELLLEISITTPILIMNPAERNLVPEDLREETNVLIILGFLQHFNFKELQILILKHMTSLSSHITWDLQTKFIILIETEDSNNYNCMSKSLSKELKSWNIYNILKIVLVSSFASQMSIGWNLQVDFSLSLYMFLSYPHHSPVNGCPNIQTVQLTKCDGVSLFMEQIDVLKLRKFSENFLGCPFRISTFPFEPFVFPPTQIHVNSSFTLLSYTQGLEIELLHLITQVLNLSLVFAPPPEDGELWGRECPNGTWTGIRGDVIYGRTDVAVCATVLSKESKKVMSPTIPYVRGGFVWVVPCSKPFPRWWSMFRIFNVSSWLSIISSVFFAFGVMLMLSRLSRSKKSNRHISITIFDFLCTILGLAISKLPHDTHLQLFFISWIVYSLAVNTVFQAFLTGYLVDPGRLPQLKDLKDLLNSGLEYGYLPTMDGYFESRDNIDLKILKNRKVCADTIGCLYRIAGKGDFAELISRQIVDYMKYYKFQNSKGESLLCPFAEDFVQYNVVMYLVKGSPFVKHFNVVIIWAKEAGLIDKWYRNIMYRSKLKAEKGSVQLIDDGYSVLSIKHFQGVLFLYGIGMAIALAAFICEKSYRRVFKFETKVPNCQTMKPKSYLTYSLRR